LSASARYVLVRSGPRRRPRACPRGPECRGGGRPKAGHGVRQAGAGSLCRRGPQQLPAAL